MKEKGMRIDLLKLLIYILKRSWILIICAIIGFGAMYYYTSFCQDDTYTTSGTMYVYNANPNIINYQYANSNDLDSAVRLVDTYKVVVNSHKVLDAVAERLSAQYPGITAAYISRTIAMSSVAETGVLAVLCTTKNAQMSADICNAVLDAAPAEIIRVVSAGSIEIIDYAGVPAFPDDRNPIKKGIIGGLALVILAGGILVLCFLLNRKVNDSKELEDSFTPPVLASILREKKETKDPTAFLLNEKSPMEVIEGYAKLRMNLLFTLSGKKNNVVVVTSALPGEGKSTVASNLAISCAMSGKRVLLIDCDLRRASQRKIFNYSRRSQGVSEAVIGTADWRDCLVDTDWEELKLLPAGQFPPNPAELLSSPAMAKLLEEAGQSFDLIVADAPPVNVVSDPLVLSTAAAGCIFVTRQGFSDHREIRKALIAAEMTDMDVLGFVFYGETLERGYYYSKRKYYKKYYHAYDNRNKAEETNGRTEKK